MFGWHSPYARRAGKRGGSSQPARPGQATKAPKTTAWVVFACMTFPTLVFVFGLPKPSLTLIASVTYRIPHQPPERVLGGGGGGELFSPSPTWFTDVPAGVFLRRAANAAAVRLSDMPTSDKFLGGLLAAGFVNEESCRSRYQSTAYRKPSPHKPSPYLVRRLRDYEEHHRRCAPHTGGFNRTLKYLKAKEVSPEEEMGCRYVLWTPWSGLGNRILSLASTFLYALLTNRVVLIDRGKDMTSLFCEPFPNTTWLMPEDFPVSSYRKYNRNYRLSYGNLLKRNNISTGGAAGGSSRPPSFVYLHLANDYETEDMHFFCEPDQAILRTVPWLFLRSDNYLVPAFFLNRDFEPELSRMFPEKETVFHHLGRYLFHPTNDVWGMVTRYYRSYLAAAKERLGIQIRIFRSNRTPFNVVFNQIINCTVEKGLLPEVDRGRSYSEMAADSKKTKAVLIASLHSGYAEKMRDMYWEHPAAGDGALVEVHQPTHEERQQTDLPDHDVKAWMEMNLLGLTDELVTTARSTFGYVGQALAGTRPWILARPEKGVMPQPTCSRDFSMEPCLHSPPWYVCREKKNGDNGRVVPFVTPCGDAGGGLKLVDRT